MEKKVKKEKKTFKGEIEDLAKYLTGESKLREKEEEVEKVKVKNIQKQKDVRRKKIIKGEEVLETEEETKKIVQKIKLYEWEVPVRFRLPFDIRTYLIIVALCMVFIVYLAVLGHYGLMAAIIALLFFVYVSGTAKPMMAKHEINMKGVDSMGTLYEWFMLKSFWFSKKGDEYMLQIETKLKMPARLLLIVEKKDLKTVFALLQDKLLYKDIRKQGWLEKKSFGEYIKLEDI
ncbi:hypothetical protein M0R04_02610 [Candidatus Dojkabacteria bacterium]|jgi:hypothetical protein|nr:hypothetical protein [Candidatus Dojkabacteria bacterium]